MKILFETDGEQLITHIQHWFKELESRLFNSNVEFSLDDIVAIKEFPYIIVMANITITDYDDDLTPFQRKNVTIKHIERKLKPEVSYWSDDGRFLISSGSGTTMNIQVELMPIYCPDLIIMLNEDGTLFKDGLDSTTDLEKMIADNEVKSMQNRLDNMLVDLEENSKTLEL